MSKLTLIPKVAAQGILGVLIFGLYIIIYLFFFGAVITGGVYVYSHVTDHFHHQQSPALQQYVSTQGGFEISFPYGLPTVQNHNMSLQGVNIPYTYYYTGSDNNNIQYILTEYNFPSNQFNFNSDNKGNLETALQSLLNSYAQSQKESITSSKFTSFLGNTAIMAHLGNTSYVSVNEGYYMSFVSSNNIYDIQVWGGSQSNFQNFINSFKFTN